MYAEDELRTKTNNDMNQDIKNAVLYGIGLMAGKHNLDMLKEEREQIAEKYAKQLANSSSDIHNVSIDDVKICDCHVGNPQTVLICSACEGKYK